ncbi:hypothetical protein EG329_001930 [Mollisiaceae sp. DMI_Dod_QoI]|nr:hypothetical protein EG329_001930 [Helotiales sp. DMI_Dod_QoI]
MREARDLLTSAGNIVAAPSSINPREMGKLNEAIPPSRRGEFQAHEERLTEAQSLRKGDQAASFQAVQLSRENLDWSLANLGPDHAITVYDQEELSMGLADPKYIKEITHRAKDGENAKQSINDLWEEVRNLDEKALETRSRIEGTSPPSRAFLETQRNLALDYARLGNDEKASELLQKNYDARRSHPELGEDHTSTVSTGHSLAARWHQMQRHEEARALNQKILDARIRLNKPEEDINESRNALLRNCKRIENIKKRELAKEAEKKSGSNVKPSNNTSSPGSRWSGGKSSEPTEIAQSPLPEITFKYVDPRASGIHHGSDIASTESGSNNSSPMNIPFRRGSGRVDRQSTPLIIDASPDQRQNQPRPKPWAQESRAPPKTQVSGPSKNLKPTSKNASKQAEPSRARSVSAGKDKSIKSPPRARSASPPAATRKHYRQLSDAGPGKDDEISSRDVNNWFYSLNNETQALLDPLRRARGKRVKIAILDTGIDIGHPCFAVDQAGERSSRRIKNREDFLDPRGNAHDVCGHGTHCVGLLRKVAPEADIYIARVAKDFNGDLNPDVVAKAILRACRDTKDEDGKKNWGVDIITMSFGFYGRVKVVQTAIQEALAKPVLVFAAASNNGTQRDVTFPAWLSGVICVNSATATGTASLFNPEPTPRNNFSIIGENIKSAWIRSPGRQNENTEKVMSGTSMATPIAAGVAALVLEYVLQNDPESVLIEQLDDLKHPDGMPEVFAKMVRGRGKYLNVVPWELLSVRNGRNMVTAFIEHALRNFRGE